MNLVHRLLGTLAFGPESLRTEDQTRTLIVDGRERSYVFHLPPNLDANKPTPVVRLFHGAGASGSLMAPFTGMRKKGEKAKLIAVYPNSIGIGPFLAFNAGDFVGKLAGSADDVKFVACLLDDMGSVANV